MSHKVIVKFAPVLTADRFNDPAWTRPGRRMYYPGALKFRPGKTTVPLLVDHGREIGTVTRLFQMDWTDGGPWICASAIIEGEPPCWLERGRGASFGSRVLDRREVTIRDTTADVVAYALLDEVSLLITQNPTEPCAEVLSIEREAPPAAREEVFYGDGTLVRRNCGTITAVGGVPVRGSAGNPRREGHNYVIDHDDGSATIYANRAEYLSDVGVR